MHRLALIPPIAIFLWICLYDANFDKGLVKTDVYLHGCTFYFADGNVIKGSCKDSVRFSQQNDY